MAEKKATKRAASKTTTAARKTAVKKAEFVINAENVGFRAGDVYQALAAAGEALTATEIAKQAKISAEEAFLGIGWLFKEGKIKDVEGKIALA
ncbi:MAG: winged helix-turn-helix domain-containing protein [Prevotella sp.]|jgi:hypothetical protein